MILGAIAFAFDNDGFSVVQDAVQDGTGKGAVVVEEPGPVFVSLIGMCVIPMPVVAAEVFGDQLIFVVDQEQIKDGD